MEIEGLVKPCSAPSAEEKTSAFCDIASSAVLRHFHCNLLFKFCLSVSERERLIQDRLS